jgi:hypothetical protein
LGVSVTLRTRFEAVVDVAVGREHAAPALRKGALPATRRPNVLKKT